LHQASAVGWYLNLNPGLIASRKPQKPLKKNRKAKKKKTTFIILPDTYNRPD